MMLMTYLFYRQVEAFFCPAALAVKCRWTSTVSHSTCTGSHSL